MVKNVRVGNTLFFRGPKSRKPYKVEVTVLIEVFTRSELEYLDPNTFADIRPLGSCQVPGIPGEDGLAHGWSYDLGKGLPWADIKPDDILDGNVLVKFTNKDEEIVSIRYLYHTWKEAEAIAPIRPPRS